MWWGCHPTFFIASVLADPRASDASGLLLQGKAWRYQQGGGTGSPLDQVKNKEFRVGNVVSIFCFLTPPSLVNQKVPDLAGSCGTICPRGHPDL